SEFRSAQRTRRPRNTRRRQRPAPSPSSARIPRFERKPPRTPRRVSGARCAEPAAHDTEPSGLNPSWLPSLSTTIQVQVMAATLAIVINAHALDRSPGGELEIVRHDARAFLELLFENRRHQLIPDRQQVHGKEIGGGVILLQKIAVDHARG